MKRLVVLASGNGSNLQAMLDAGLPVVAVVSNHEKAFALERARRAGLPALVLPPHPDRAEYDRQLADLVAEQRPDWVILAGWMLILSREFLDRFPNRVINLHPALPGAFPGLRAIERAWEAYQRGQLTHTGIMVHVVPDEGVDCGPVLATAKVPIQADDTLEKLKERIHAAEHRLLVQTVREVMTDAPSSALGLG